MPKLLIAYKAEIIVSVDVSEGFDYQTCDDEIWEKFLQKGREKVNVCSANWQYDEEFEPELKD